MPKTTKATLLNNPAARDAATLPQLIGLIKSLNSIGESSDDRKWWVYLWPS